MGCRNRLGPSQVRNRPRHFANAIMGAGTQPIVPHGLLEQAPNADHRRSQLVRLTEDGTAKYSAVDARQAVWENRLASGIDRAQLETAARVLDELCRRLEAGDDQEPDEGGHR